MKDKTKAESKMKERKKMGLWTTMKIKIETESPVTNKATRMQIAFLGIGLQLSLFCSLTTALERSFISLVPLSPSSPSEAQRHFTKTTTPGKQKHCAEIRETLPTKRHLVSCVREEHGAVYPVNKRKTGRVID